MTTSVQTARALGAEVTTTVAVSLIKYEATGNVLFLWEAIQAVSDPRLEGAPIVLPTILRNYLHEASAGVLDAALRKPGDFSQGALGRLGFSEGRGASPAQKYARDQSVGILLSIYEELKLRHNSAQAELLMGGALCIDPKSMRGRLSAARKTFRQIRDRLLAAGFVVPEGGSRDWDNIPDFVLLNLLRGMPDVFWARQNTRLDAR